MRFFGILGKSLKVFGAILLLCVGFIACYFFQPDKAGGWQMIADSTAFKMEIAGYLAVPGLIGAAALFFGFRLDRKGVARADKTQG